jgi:hypothetical protein
VTKLIGIIYDTVVMANVTAQLNICESSRSLKQRYLASISC